MPTITHTMNNIPAQADLITSVAPAIGGIDVTLAGGAVFFASDAMVLIHTPVADDYLVTQDDGFQYLAAAAVFERQYSAITIEAPVDEEVDEVVHRIRLRGDLTVEP